MAERKAKTIQLGAAKSEYARVAERLKLFREDCPNGSIKTTFKVLDGGQIVYTAYVLKDKSNPQSADATGHSMGVSKADKDFEKLETKAVGRALALLGYLASGEIASAEEMEDFLEYQENKKLVMIEDATDKLKSAKNIDELKKAWAEIPAEAKLELAELKDQVKESFNKKVEVKGE